MSDEAAPVHGLKPGDWKMTVEVLASGQPRAYADTVHTYRVYFHRLPFKLPGRLWEPAAEWSEAIVRPKLKAICGWVEDGEGRWPSPRLVFIKNVGPGIWEFSVREPYLD